MPDQPTLRPAHVMSDACTTLMELADRPGAAFRLALRLKMQADVVETTGEAQQQRLIEMHRAILAAREEAELNPIQKTIGQKFKVFWRSFFGNSPGEKKLARIEQVHQSLEKGIYKRIDENREMLELIQKDFPQLLNQSPWVFEWIKSLDHFLVQAAEAVGIENTTGNSPRPWPPYRNQPFAKTPIPGEPSIDLATMAEKVSNDLQREYYEKQLTVLQQQAQSIGYFFSHTNTKYQNTKIPDNHKHKLARAVQRLKSEFLSPDMAEYDVNLQVQRNMDDGYAQQHLESILRSLQANGIYIRTFASPNNNENNTLVQEPEKE